MVVIRNSGFASGVTGGEIADVGGRKVKINSGWFRGNDARYRPTKPALLSPEAVKAFIIDGWAPPAPVISKATRVLTFGSCFAGNIARHLEQAGFNLLSNGPREDGVFAIACNEAIVNTFTIRQLLEWVYEGKTPTEPVWKQEGELYAFSENHRARMRGMFASAEVFIITLGLSEVWFNRETGEVFSSSIPRDQYDEARHGFRLSTVPENIANLETVYRLLRQHAPQTRIMFTLSPIPLIATFRPVSCISANSVSKAVLRVAVDELCRNHADDDRLHYWPSYEIVMEGFQDSFVDDNRHVRKEILSFIMALFEQVYCEGGLSDDALLERYFDAAVSTGQVSRRAARVIEDGESPHEVASGRARHNPEEAILLLRRYAIEKPSAAITAQIEAIRQAAAEKETARMDAKAERLRQRRESR